MGRNSRGKLVSLLYQLYIYNILVIIRGGGDRIYWIGSVLDVLFVQEVVTHFI